MSLVEQDASVIRLSAFPKGRLYGSDVIVKSCTASADACRPGDLFVALESSCGDGHHEVERAIAAGAAAVIAERYLPVSVSQCVVADSREAFARLCQALAGNPSRELRLNAVCGTRGVSATATMLESVLAGDGRTVSDRIRFRDSDAGDGMSEQFESVYPLRLARSLADARANGCTDVVAEVSSRMLSSRMLAGCELEAAVITNLGRDYLDWHGSTARYHQALLRVLDYLSTSGFVVANVDDKGTRAALESLRAPVLTVGMRREAEVTATVLERFAGEQTFLVTAGRDTVPVRVPLTGDAHVYACLSAIGVGLVRGLSLEHIARGIESVIATPDALHYLDSGSDVDVFLGAAATPEALREMLHSVSLVTKGRITCVLGEGPPRNRERRAQRGTVAERFADQVIISSDANPPQRNLRAAHDLLDGFDRPAAAHLLPDRTKAIFWALSNARPGDAVLLVAPGDDTCAATWAGVAASDADIVGHWRRSCEKRQALPWGPT